MRMSSIQTHHSAPSHRHTVWSPAQSQEMEPSQNSLEGSGIITVQMWFKSELKAHTYTPPLSLVHLGSIVQQCHLREFAPQCCAGLTLCLKQREMMTAACFAFRSQTEAGTSSDLILMCHVCEDGESEETFMLIDVIVGKGEAVH